MSGIILNYPEAQDAVDRFLSEANSIEASIQSVRSQLSALQGSFQGRASDDFTSLMEDYERSAKSVNENLSDLARALSKWVSSVEEFEAGAFSR